MSYSIKIITADFGDTYRDTIDVTYNLSKYFYKYLDEESGIRWLYGRNCKDTLPRLKELRDTFFALFKEELANGIIRKDYWTECAANAMLVTTELICIAQNAPDNAEWDGD